MKIEITIEGPGFAILHLHNVLKPLSPVLEQEAGDKARVRLLETAHGLDERLVELSSTMRGIKETLGLEEDLEIRARNLAYSEPPGAGERSRDAFEPIPDMIVQPWHASLSRDRDAQTILLHHEKAFGTGRHPSTRLCLECLFRLAQGGSAPWWLEGRSVLDFGCGTGLLAIAAVRMGAARALGVEIDRESVETAKKNVALNGLSEKIVISRGSWETVLEKYDLILANLVPSVLVRTGREIAEHLIEGGRVVLSGFGVHQMVDMEQFFQSQGLMICDKTSLDGWAALLMGKKSDHGKDDP
jgi:2-polyprenyl-3-methyl-5-hydroxy-6-metoxy-1,4-benzoquinol methylase